MKEIAEAELDAEIARIAPAELLLSEDFQPVLPLGLTVQRLAEFQFDTAQAERELTRQFGTRDLSGFGCTA